MKVLGKLTLKNLRYNKARTIVTILGIMLSAALILVVAGIAASAKQSLINAEILYSGNYDISVTGEFTDKDIQKISENSSVHTVYSVYTVGTAAIEEAISEYQPYAQIVHTDPSLLSDFQSTLQEGRYAQKEDEIVLSPSYLRWTSKSYHVGDKITFQLGERHFAPEYLEKSGLNDEIIPEMVPVFPEYEQFVKTEAKTYTVVGIMKAESGYLQMQNYQPYVYTCAPSSVYPTLLIRLTDQAEPDYIQVFSDIFGVDADLFDDFVSMWVVSDQTREIQQQLSQSEYNITDFQFNDLLLITKGINKTTSGDSYDTIFLVAAVIILVVILASVFIIRSSFSISVTEKTRLYGMLSSVGASSGQIRNNVLFEALILGLIGIPLGIGLGVGVTWALIALCNLILGDLLHGVVLTAAMPLWAILIAVVSGAVTIFLSALIPAIRASRIPPMEAIRSTRDVRVKKRGDMAYRPPAFIKKLFGTGGVLAWKNMKRSRRQYRTTVISLIISVSVFLTVFSFVEYSTRYLESRNFYQKTAYNMHVSLSAVDEEDREYPFPDLISKYEKIAHIEGIDNYRYYIAESFDFSFGVSMDDLSEDYRTYSTDYWNETPDRAEVYYALVGVTDETFRSLCEQTGHSFEECKTKAFITNKTKIYPQDEPSKETAILNSPVGMSLQGTSYYYDGQDENEIEENDQNMKSASTGSLEVIDTIPDGFYVDPEDDKMIIVTMDQLQAILPDDPDSYQLTGGMLLNAQNPDEMEDTLRKLSKEETGGIIVYSVSNYSREINNLRAIILVLQILVYGFIIVVTLIGVTNIFNTITANMKLRRKEFAMLQSIGTTKQEFNRMIRLESLLYTAKSLMIGLPLGIAGTVLVHYFFNKNIEENQQISYLFPWLAVLISILAVLLMLWVIMRFSLSKLKKQNIIETIRSDNI